MTRTRATASEEGESAAFGKGTGYSADGVAR